MTNPGAVEIDALMREALTVLQARRAEWDFTGARQSLDLTNHVLRVWRRRTRRSCPTRPAGGCCGISKRTAAGQVLERSRERHPRDGVLPATWSR
jgi:hypothetical protein